MANEWDQFPDAGGTVVAESFDHFPDAEKRDPFADFPDAQAQQPKTLADAMSGRYGRDVHIPKDVRVPTMAETGLLPAGLIEGALRYTNPIGLAQVANEAIAPDAAATKIGKGVIGGASEALAGFTTPESLSALAIMPESRIAQIALNLGFGANAVAELPGQIKAYGATDKPEEKAKIATGIATSLGLPAWGLTHGLMRKAPNESRPSGDQSIQDIPESSSPSPQSEVVASVESSPQPPLEVPQSLQSETAIARDVPQVPRPESTAPIVEQSIPEIQGNVSAAPNPEPQAASDVTGQTAPEPVQHGEFPQEGYTATDSPAASEPATTGIAQRVHDSRAEAGKIDEVTRGIGASPEAMINRGRELMSNGVDPVARMSELEKSGSKAISADDMALFRAEMERRSQATNAAEDGARQNPATKPMYDAAWKAESEWANRIKPFQTEWHKIGQTMQGETNLLDGSYTGLRRMFVEETGRDVRPHEEVKLKQTADRLKNYEDSVKRAKKAYDNVIDRTTRSRAPVDVNELRSYFAEKLKKMTPCKL